MVIFFWCKSRVIVAFVSLIQIELGAKKQEWNARAENNISTQSDFPHSLVIQSRCAFYVNLWNNRWSGLGNKNFKQKKMREMPFIVLECDKTKWVNPVNLCSLADKYHK